MSIRARVALFGGGVVALAVLLFGLVVYFPVKAQLESQQDTELKQEAIRIGLNLHRPGFSGQLRVSYPFSPEDLRASSNPFVELLDASGTPTGSTGTIDGANPVMPAWLLQETSPNTLALETIKVQDVSVRVLIGQWQQPGLGSGYFVVGRPMSAISHQLAALRLFLFAGALLSLIGALAATWIVTGRALRPLERMAGAAEEIGRTQDLSRRLPESGRDDEVGRLTGSFNRMLQQLQDAYSRLQGALAAQRRFVADASHELRTPLTTIRSNAGLMLKREDITAEDRQAALEDIADESERMSRLVQDLLMLARADAGYHLDRMPLDLRPIVQDVLRQAQTVHPTRAFELSDGVAAPISGNSDALKQLIWILVDNAVKFTPEGGHVRVGLAGQHGSVDLTVADEGPGIPETDRERIFERFFQADPARSGGGSGLGLAIAQWIVSEHGGKISARNADNGAVFEVELPTS